MLGRNIDFGKGGISQLQHKKGLVFHLAVHADRELRSIGVVPFRFGLDVNMDVNFRRGFDLRENFRRMGDFQREILNILAVDGNCADLLVLSLFFHCCFS